MAGAPEAAARPLVGRAACPVPQPRSGPLRGRRGYPDRRQVRGGLACRGAPPGDRGRHRFNVQAYPITAANCVTPACPSSAGRVRVLRPPRELTQALALLREHVARAPGTGPRARRPRPPLDRGRPDPESAGWHGRARSAGRPGRVRTRSRPCRSHLTRTTRTLLGDRTGAPPRTHPARRAARHGHRHPQGQGARVGGVPRRPRHRRVPCRPVRGDPGPARRGTSSRVRRPRPARSAHSARLIGPREAAPAPVPASLSALAHDHPPGTPAGRAPDGTPDARATPCRSPHASASAGVTARSFGIRRRRWFTGAPTTVTSAPAARSTALRPDLPRRRL